MTFLFILINISGDTYCVAGSYLQQLLQKSPHMIFGRSTGKLSAQVVSNNVVKKLKETENSGLGNVRKQVAA